MLSTVEAKTKALMEQKRDELFKEIERLYVYASLRRDEDTTNSTYQGMADRAMQLYVHASTAASYIEPEILALPQETLDRFVQETIDHLAEYAPVIMRCFCLCACQGDGIRFGNRYIQRNQPLLSR